MTKKEKIGNSYSVKEFTPIDPTELDFDLSYYIYLLLRDEPFFAKLSRYLRKVPTTAIPTAGVCLNVDSLTFDILYNPKFFLSLTKEQRVWVIMHEFYHIALGHCTDRRPNNVEHKKANIAMDEAINSLENMAPGTPEFAIMPGRKTNIVPGTISDIVKDHAPGQAMEYYLNKLMNEEFSEDSFDDHSNWDVSAEEAAKLGEDPETIKEIASEKLKSFIEKVANECDKEGVEGSQSWGSVSQEMRKRIRESLVPKLDPKKALSYFIKASVRADRRHSITKINRRWPYIHAGRRWNRTAYVGVAIDQSGSVSDAMLEKFFAWLNEFSKFAKFLVIPFDDRVFEDKIYVWEKNQKRIKERVLNGGTDFSSPTKYVNDHPELDGLIICTDMCAPQPIACKVKRIWVTDRANGSSPYLTPKGERILIVD